MVAERKSPTLTGDDPAAAERSPSHAASEPVLELRGLSKTFGGVRALDDVSLDVRAGEIHGLLGENGSGKSTLIKILAGFHVPDPGGELIMAGKPVRLPLHPGEFRKLGMKFVHQDLGLIPSLSVVENLRIEDLATSRDWRISWGAERKRAREIFSEYGVHLDPDKTVADLRPVERALLAIVRAVAGMNEATDSAGGGLLVLDEPTVFLPRADTELLFGLTRRIAATGAGVLFVSHDLDEVRRLTDRATVLRDGRVHGTAVIAETSSDELIEMIIGRQLAAAHHVEHSDDTVRETRAEVVELRGEGVDDATFEIRHGEILGITGLTGSGFEDVPYLMFGAKPSDSGSLEMDGARRSLKSMTPQAAFNAGMALIPADRQRDGSVGSLTVADNVSLQILDRFQQGPLLNRRKLMQESRSVLSRFDVRPNDPSLNYSGLSGGNQQKVLMAKWLQTAPKILLVHEPTQGVDVGAREEIFTVLRDAARDGMSVLCASSDYEQLALICDRVLIFRQRRIATELTGESLTKDTISEQCYASVAPRMEEAG